MDVEQHASDHFALYGCLVSIIRQRSPQPADETSARRALRSGALMTMTDEPLPFQ